MMHGGDFVRVRVAVNVLEPLCRGRRVTFIDDSNGWVSFRYERLQNFCFWCGHLDHIDKDCAVWVRGNGTLKAEDQQYGVWLRAKQFNLSRKSFVEVKGFSTFTSSTPSSSGLNVIECPDDVNSMEVAPSMLEQRGKGGLDWLKGCSDVPGINSTCPDVVSTREVSPNVVEKLTALVPTNYELPSTSIVVVSNSNKVLDEENPVLSNEIVHKNSGAFKDREGDCGLIGEGNFAQGGHSDGEFKMGWVIQGPLAKGNFERLKRKGRPKKFNSLLGESSLGARKGDVKKGQ